MRRERIIFGGEIFTSWICIICGEVVDQVISENPTCKQEKIAKSRFDPTFAQSDCFDSEGQKITAALYDGKSIFNTRPASFPFGSEYNVRRPKAGPQDLAR